MNEATLLSGLKNKDKMVFDFVFNFYYSGLCSFALQYTKNAQQAEDLVQDFFVSLWINASKIEIKNSLKAYFFSSVKNRCLDFEKHKKVVQKHQLFFNINQSDAEPATENLYAETELRSILENGLSKLQPRCREIFELSRKKGMSNQEIADQLQLSKRTIELQISTALKTLRSELADFFPLFIIMWLLR
jgi:RNA polymerase sigma-70 factor, ECF subfamily